MIGYFKVSAIGTDHMDKKDGVCQDHSDVIQTADGHTIAVIADGLGSASKSDIGSRIAVETVISYISENIRKSREDRFYTALLKEAYSRAYTAVIRYAKKIGEAPSELNTTLTSAVYDGKKLYYGQCGDGGIIALTYNGEYVCVTQVKKGEAFNETFPLLGGEANWSFGKYDGSICALTMMTDGIFDIVCHPLLVNESQKINIPFIRRFMDRNILKANSPADFDALQRGVEKFIRGNGIEGVTDDKTIVGLINTKIMPSLKDDEYYKEPDWEKLKNDMKNKLKQKPPAISGPQSERRINNSRLIEEKSISANTDLFSSYLRTKKANCIMRNIVIVQFAVIVILSFFMFISLSCNKEKKEAKKQKKTNNSADDKPIGKTSAVTASTAPTVTQNTAEKLPAKTGPKKKDIDQEIE